MGITYQYYFSSSRDTLKMTMREEMNAIDSAYLKALGVSDKTFTLQGSVSDCDNQVKQACAAAEAALSQLSFHGSYTYTVYNNTSSSTSTAIYTYNINR
ncbi:MAG: hypothetical protein Q4E59_03020 [Bacteroidales bacterium]|nr:hypothetical protein [Bacteroidales bacterium]